MSHGFLGIAATPGVLDARAANIWRDFDGYCRICRFTDVTKILPNGSALDA